MTWGRARMEESLASQSVLWDPGFSPADQWRSSGARCSDRLVWAAERAPLLPHGGRGEPSPADDLRGTLRSGAPSDHLDVRQVGTRAGQLVVLPIPGEQLLTGGASGDVGGRRIVV